MTKKDITNSVYTKQALQKTRLEDDKNKFLNEFHTKNELFRGLTFEELIDTVTCNEAWKDEIRYVKVFEELIDARLIEAKRLLRQHMNDIDKECNNIKD